MRTIKIIYSMNDENKLQGNKLDFNSIKKASLILRTLNNKVCQKIYELLLQNREMTVTEIYSALDLEQSVASMHLAKMRRHKIVTTKRSGKNILYGLNIEKLTNINTILNELSEASLRD